MITPVIAPTAPRCLLFGDLVPAFDDENSAKADVGVLTMVCPLTAPQRSFTEGKDRTGINGVNERVLSASSRRSLAVLFAVRPSDPGATPAAHTQANADNFGAGGTVRGHGSNVALDNARRSLLFSFILQSVIA